MRDLKTTNNLKMMELLAAHVIQGVYCAWMDISQASTVITTYEGESNGLSGMF
jgi:hypothetical protein